MSCFRRSRFAPVSVPTSERTHSTAIRTRERQSQVVEDRNCHTSGSPAEGCVINLGAAPGALQGPSKAAPSGSAACEGEGRTGNTFDGHCAWNGYWACLKDHAPSGGPRSEEHTSE